jgi:hypothetical protein
MALADLPGNAKVDFVIANSAGTFLSVITCLASAK